MLDDTDDIHPLFAGAPKSVEFRKLRKRLVQNAREAIETYGMVRPGDRWLVCLSGGKDSYTLLAILHELKWRGLLPVDLLACNLDQGQPGFPATVLPEFLTRMGVPHRIDYADTYSIVTDKIAPGGTMCSLCSRLRRGNLYRIAREEGPWPSWPRRTATGLPGRCAIRSSPATSAAARTGCSASRSSRSSTAGKRAARGGDR